MKTFKKLLAVILSVMMLLSVVVLPATAEGTAAAAETTISKYISLLDLSKTTLNDKKTGVPSGIPNWSVFYSTSIANGFTGNQEIVQNNDGSRSWKLYFDTATNNGGYLNGYKNNMIAVKFAIPAEYAKLVSGIKLDYTNGVVSGGTTTGDVLYGQFGISDGTDYSAVKRTGTTDISVVGTADGTASVLEANVNDLFVVTADSKMISAEKKNIAEDAKWSYGTEFAYVYLVLTARRCGGDEGSWAAINDIGITISGTEEDFANIATTETYDLLNLDEMELGMVGTDSAYADGVEEFMIKNGSSSNDMTKAYSGSKEVIENADGSRSLKLDLTSIEFSRSATDTQATRNRIFEGGYHNTNGTVYMLKLAVPSNHVHLVDSIKIGVNKQTTADVVYAFGVTDGTYYSKIGNSANYYYDGTSTGYIGVEVANFRNSRMLAGSGIGYYRETSDRLGDNEFTHLYLLISADESVGYVTIDEISYTITATGAEYKKYQGFITGFETLTATATDNAISGEKAYQWSVPAGNAYHTRTIQIGGNTNASQATGFSFWVNNPNSGGEISLKVRLLNADSSVGYFIGDYIKIPANSSRKLTVSFDNIRIDTLPGNAGASMESAGGDYVALTPEQIADLTVLRVLCRTHDLDGDSTTRDVYVNLDNIEYVFEESIPNANVDLSAATGASAVTEDGKLEFVSTEEGSDLIATIPVSEKFFRYADKMTLNFDNATAAEVKYKVTLHGTNDSGEEAHWKWGYKDWTNVLSASVTDYSVALPLGGYASSFNPNTIHEGTLDTATCKYCNPSTQDGWGGSSGHANNPPSATEKDSITSIQIRVSSNIGAGEKVTLNSITLSYAGNNITSNVVTGEDTGALNLEVTKAFAGETAGFFVTPAEMYYASNIEVLDSKGNAIDYALSSEYNFDNYFVFTMPADSVVINAYFSAVSGTVAGTSEYDNSTDTVKFGYTIPVVAGKAYNEELDKYQTLNNYGVIVTSEEALAKYGIDFETLTPEAVAELKESGHHVANYIALVDSENDIVTETGFSYDFGLNIENISVRARRAPLLMKSYVNFVDDEGNVAPFYNTTSDTIDTRVYGDYFQSEFNAYYGINVSQVAQGEIDPTNAKVAMALTLEFWQTLRDKGFDHVRLPVKIANYVDENGELIEEQMLKIDTMVDNALTAGLCVVFDVHGYKDINTNFTANKDGFVSAWEKLSDRYAHLPLSVAFELINEPRKDVGGDDPLTLTGIMDLQNVVLDDIRATVGNETRWVVLSTCINQAGYLDDVQSHEIFNNEYIMMDIHDYSPMTFTYSGIDWNDSYYNEDGTLKYPTGATEYSLDGIQANADRAVAFTEATGIPCWLGEYGAYKPDADKELEYVAGINNIYDEYGMGRCMWELWTAWGPYNATNDAWNDSLIDAILNPADYLPAE